MWILAVPARGLKEYFIVENRWRGTSYDKAMADVGGLAIWHIMEDPATQMSSLPPPGVTAEQWATIGGGLRRAVRMLRPKVTPPFDDATALRDGSDSNTGFDVLSDDPNPARSSLKWGDGTPSGFAIRNLSPAGAIMSADLIVPW